jgi:MFS family permease
VVTARNAVLATFFLNGFAFSTWASRIPSIRHDLDLGPGQLGLFLLAGSIGSVASLPTAGGNIARFGARRTVVAATLVEGLGLLLLGLGGGALGSVPVAALGLLMVGLGTGTWDVAMNVEGAEVERLLGRSIMPRFHAGFSLGTVVGAGVGSLVTYAGVGVGLHLGIVGLLVMLLGGVSVRGFLVAEPHTEENRPASHALKAWTEPRTLMIGVMVLAMALTEGVANDWLAWPWSTGTACPPGSAPPRSRCSWRR